MRPWLAAVARVAALLLAGVLAGWVFGSTVAWLAGLLGAALVWHLGQLYATLHWLKRAEAAATFRQAPHEAAHNLCCRAMIGPAAQAQDLLTDAARLYDTLGLRAFSAGVAATPQAAALPTATTPQQYSPSAP